MVTAPLEPSDPFQLINSFLGDTSSQTTGFTVAPIPTASGLGPRQGVFPANRPATSKRKLIKFLVPDSTVVEMYVNPQNVSYTHSKLITQTRTKGGYNLSYWGMNLIDINIQGNTGSSGIEGLNVLYDVYQAENVAFDPYALTLGASVDAQTFGAGLFDTSALGSGTDFLTSLIGAASDATLIPVNPLPTLAQLAFTVEMYWNGEAFRGYFNSMEIRRSSTNFLIEYSMRFTATQKRGFQQNSFGWEKVPTQGSSNSNSFGPPHSYGLLVSDTRIAP